MKRRHPRARLPYGVALLVFLASFANVFALEACGSRTELDLYFAPTATFPPDAAAPPDAALDDSSVPDVAPPPEEPDAAPPPTDAVPPIDAVTPDAALLCPDGGGVTVAYLWGESGRLYTFDPTTLATQELGVVSCGNSQLPWTLSVSRAGYAFMVYQDWNIYRVDLTTLACTSTPYVVGQLGFTAEEAIAVSRDEAAERLYVYDLNVNQVPALAVSDLTSFVLSSIGPVTPNPNSFPVDMQADAYGRLFVLSEEGVLIQVDAVTGAVIGQDQTSFQAAGSWAVMTWNDEIFFFGGGEAYRYDLTTKQVIDLGDIVDDSIVGASAAACIH
ncbi:MAG: hypothetical protein ACLQVI_31825 [Polyangiaceae bacterium]